MDLFTSAYANARRRWVLPVCILLLLLAGAALINVYERNVRNEVILETSQEMQRLTAQGRSILIGEFNRLRDNISFLHATPPIAGLTRADSNNGIDPFDGTSFDQWKFRLETIFIAMLQNNVAIDQLRIIAADEAGSELIRVDRRSGKIGAIADEFLQDKGGRSYFKQAVELEPEELYVSRINLNREFGKIEFPIKPSLRLVIPIFSEQGMRFGFLIMNVNAGHFLERLHEEVEGSFDIVLTDDEGYYIDHPNEDYRFSRDLRPERNWNQDYRIEKGRTETLATAVELSTGESHPVYSGRLQFASSPSSVLFLHAIAPSGWISSQIWNRRATTYGLSGVSISVMTFVLLVVLRGYRNSARLAETRAEHEAIIRSSSEGIIGLTLSGKISSFNNAAEEMFKTSRSDSIGKDIAELDLFRDLEITDVIETVRSSKSTLSIDSVASSNNQTDRELALTVSPIMNTSRQLTGVAVIARDVTQERAAQRQIQQANAELEEQVAKRTQELADAHQQALKASDMKSAFISNVSHEMRTPLNGMVGAHKLIQREPLSESQKKYLDMAETSCSALTTLINDILDLSKIEAGKLEFETRPFDPLLLFEAVANSSAIRAREKGIDLILDTANLSHSEFIGDAGRLKQVLNNLLSNAIKFTQEGYVALSVSSRFDGEKVRLDVSVEDSGIGIADENMNKLFSAFSQEDQSISTDYGGTGLGLSICKQLCASMGGEIGFESQKGQGSHFYFHICFDAETAKARTIPSPLRGQNVLVLMNHEKAAYATERLVRSLGGNVTDLMADAADGDSDAPHLVITNRDPDALDQLCSILSTMIDKETAFPNMIVVRTFERISPDYPGLLKWVSEPITQSELIACLTNPEQETPATAIGSEEQTQAVTEFPQTETAEKPHSKSTDSATVLIVDDNHINLEVAKGLLSEIDFNFLTATNGQEAIEVIRQLTSEGRSLHTILMDCQMPGMDGFEATRQIRSGRIAPQFANIPIIAMTANAMSGEKEKCLAAGMSDYITKPIEPETLLNKVFHWSQKQVSETKQTS